jgi:hypothetical protein
MRDREMGERDPRYMDAKRSQMVMQAQQMKHPERQDDYNNQPAQNDVFQQKLQNNPYQVKSYGLGPSQPINVETNHQNNLSSNQSQSDASKSTIISFIILGSEKKKKKKKKHRHKHKKEQEVPVNPPPNLIPQDNINNLNMQISMSQGRQPSQSSFPNTSQRNQPFQGNYQGLLAKPKDQNVGISQKMQMPNLGLNNPQSKLPVHAMRSPTKQNPPPKVRVSDDDPFKEIGFSGSVGGFQAPKFEHQINLFHLDEPESKSNNFEDPFADDSFSNMSMGQTPQKQLNMPQNIPMNMPLNIPMNLPQNASQNSSQQPSARKAPQSSQYNFESSQNKNNDNFDFDDININMDDLNLFDNPAPKNNPPQGQSKQNNQMMSSQSNMSQSNQMNMHNPPNNNMHNMSQSSTSQHSMSQNNTNQPMRRSQDMPQPSSKPQNQNIYQPMSNQGPPNFSENTQNLPFQTSGSPNKMGGMSGGSNMPSLNQPNANMFNTAVPVNRSNGGFNMFEEQKSGMMSMDTSQMSAEPQVISRGGPSQQKKLDLFHMDFDASNTQSQINPTFGGMSSHNNPNNFSTTQQNQNYGPTPSNYGGHSNMLAPVDPFGGVSSSGYNMGGYAAGFNTSVPNKPKKKNPFAKNPFAKNNRNKEASFTTNNAGSNINASNPLSDMFSQSNSGASQPNQNNTGANMFATTYTKPSNPLGIDIFGQKSQPLQNQNPPNREMSFGNTQPQMNYGGGSQQQQNSGHNEDPFADLFQ